MSNYVKVIAVAGGLAILAGAVWYTQFRDDNQAASLSSNSGASAAPVTIGSGNDFSTSGNADVSENDQGFTVADTSEKDVQYYRWEVTDVTGNAKHSVVFRFKPTPGDATSTQLLIIQRSRPGAEDGQTNYIMNIKDKTVTKNGLINPDTEFEMLENGSWTLRSQLTGIENPELMQVIVRPTLDEGARASILIQELSIKSQ